jgi:hypothetical protein
MSVCFVLLVNSWAQTARSDSEVFAAMDRFCRLDSAGKRLNASAARNLAHDLLFTEVPWEQPPEVIVIAECSAGPSSVQKETSEITVNYRLLARIDSSLALSHLQMLYTNQPAFQSEHFSLVFSDTHSEIGADGRQQQIKGTPAWRIKSAPQAPHVGIPAAMNYVRMMSYQTKDLRVKMNSKTASWLKLNKAFGEAKGTPLSLRMLAGRPRS